MGIIILRVGVAILSALSTASLFAIDISGVKPGQHWSLYALIAFGIFVIFVSWGWGASELKLHQKRKREHYLTRLSSLRRDGIRLQNEGWHQVLHEKIALERWWERVLEWHKEVRQNMTEISPADPDNWEDIGTFEERNFVGVSDGLAAGFLTQLAIRLEKLEKYINDRSKQ